MNNFFFDPEKQERSFIRNLHHQSWQQLDNNRSSMAAIASSSSTSSSHRNNNHHDNPSPSSYSFSKHLMSTTTSPPPPPSHPYTNFSSPANFINPNPKNTTQSNYKHASSAVDISSFQAHLAADGFNDPVLSNVVPPVTVVIEGRSICQRIDLQKHGSYESLAKALRKMFVNDVVENNGKEVEGSSGGGGDGLDLANAVPGYIVAYEDAENDLLLAGDLNWKDFVRVAKRIRILPAKPNSKKRRQGSTSGS